MTDLAKPFDSEPTGKDKPTLKIGSQRGPEWDQPDETRASAAESGGPPATAESLFPAPPVKRISADLQAEIDAALNGLSLDDLLAGDASQTASVPAAIELDQRYPARVIKCDRESVFVSFGGQHEGVAALRQFATPPEPGMTMDVVPTRLLVDDNLYEVVVPGASVEVQDWSDMSEGIVVNARVTGHNKGGLEAEVNKIRGFIPASQVSLFRVEDFESYVGQSLQCVVTECNPDRRNLVLSHRAVLEREREQSKAQLLSELAVGQVREGVVTRLQDFGAFVDLGGIDGLIHVSQLSWDRIKHPSEVLEAGQRVKVRVERIDAESGRVGLSYRDLISDPWANAQEKYAVGSIHEGTVAKLMDFGAFVRLAAGVEGLVHISEVAHHRVHKIGATLKEGQTVLVKVLSIDPDSQRISLSIKGAVAKPVVEAVVEEEEPEAPTRVVPTSNKPLKGGLGRGTGGDKFGLNW